MSFRFSKAARSVRGLKSPDKFVLITLAWYADSGRPGDAFPSVPTLASDCAMTPRGVRGILRRLEERELIKVAIGAGAGGTNSYTLDIDKMTTATPEPHSGEEPHSGGNAVPAPPEPGSANTVVDSKIPPRTPSGSSPPMPASRRSSTAELPLELVETAGPLPPRRDRSRGTRLPEDWALPDEWRRWATRFAAQHGVEIDIALAAEKFRNHWHGKAGQHGRKLDWLATWRNWIIGEYERSGRTGAHRPRSNIATVDERRSRLARAAARVGATQSTATDLGK